MGALQPNSYRQQRQPALIDFTHEREWRARPNAKLNQDIGLTGRPDEVIPLQLPVCVTAQASVVATEPHFVILVDTAQGRGRRNWSGGSRQRLDGFVTDQAIGRDTV